MSLMGAEANLAVDTLLVSEENKNLSKSSINLLVTAGEKIPGLKSKSSQHENREIA
jgi:hypothetical protein